MRIRTALPSVAATVMVAATLAIPTAAYAAPSASASASPSASPSASASASQGPAATARPKAASASASASISAPAAPQITAVSSVHLSTGLAIQARVTSAVGAKQVTATISAAGTSNAPTTVSLSLVSGTAEDGTWQTTAPLGLRYNLYNVEAAAVDTDGVQTGQPTYLSLDFVPSPVFENTSFTSAPITYFNKAVTATGTLLTYDPETGAVGGPFVSSPSQQLDISLVGPGGHDAGDSYATGADGSFSVSADPDPTTFRSGVFTLQVAYSPFATATGPTSPVISMGPLVPTRIVLDKSSGPAVADANFTISGVIQYQSADGDWVPAASIPYLAGPDNGTGWTEMGPVGADGRFSLPAADSGTIANWQISTDAMDYRWNPYFATSTAVYTVTSLTQVLSLSLQQNQTSIDEFSRLTSYGNYSSTSGHFPGNRIYLLQSPDGRTGWVNLGYIPTNGSGQVSLYNVFVNNPHGYWRLYSPAAAGYPAAYSNIVHTFRYQTLVTGGKPSATTVNRGQTVRFSGDVYQRGYGAWLPFRAPVLVIFRPTGSSDWYLMAEVWSNSKGAYSANVKVPKSGDWMVEYYYADKWHVVTAGPETYVRVR